MRGKCTAECKAGTDDATACLSRNIGVEAMSRIQDALDDVVNYLCRYLFVRDILAFRQVSSMHAIRTIPAETHSSEDLDACTRSGASKIPLDLFVHHPCYRPRDTVPKQRLDPSDACTRVGDRDS